MLGIDPENAHLKIALRRGLTHSARLFDHVAIRSGLDGIGGIHHGLHDSLHFLGYATVLNMNSS